MSWADARFVPKPPANIDKPLTVAEWETIHALCEEDTERFEQLGSKYTARNMRALTERIKARLEAAREGRVMP